MKLVSWTTVPTTLVASLGGSETLRAFIQNGGTVSVDDIPAVNGADRNFKLTAFYSTADVPSSAVLGRLISYFLCKSNYRSKLN